MAEINHVRRDGTRVTYRSESDSEIESKRLRQSRREDRSGQVEIVCVVCETKFDVGAERRKAKVFKPVCSLECYDRISNDDKAREIRRRSHHRFSGLIDFNTERSEKASKNSVDLCRRALLEARVVKQLSDGEIAVLRARVSYPTKTLKEIAELHGLRKDQFSGRLRRALEHSEQLFVNQSEGSVTRRYRVI